MTRRRNLLTSVLIGGAAAIILAGIVWSVLQMGRSPFRDPPAEGFLCSATDTQYPLNADIPITIQNAGTFRGEIFLPRLEVQKHSHWYTVSLSSEEQTSNLLGVSPGETESFTLALSAWEPDLHPGHYRAVFPLWGSEEWFGCEFDLTATSSP